MLFYVSPDRRLSDRLARKSQIATEYLCRLHQTEPDVAIFWVSAADQSSFLRSYEAIALEIPRSFREDHSLLVTEQVAGEGSLTESKTLVLVKDWLSSEDCGKWLLILDNADDPDLFSNTKYDGISLLPYLPRADNGHILITSRFQRVALSLVSGENSLIHVAPMTPQESVSLLRTRLPKDESTKNDTLELANALDFLPLAMKQSIGYINATNTSIKDYLRLFSKDDGYQRRLLEKTYRDISRDTHDDLQDSVILTWQISFDQIRIQRPAAANVLSVMGTLKREDIPAHLLTSVSFDELEFQEDIGILMQYSLISKNRDPVSYSMHRLVHLTIRIWLLREGTLGKWEAEALRLVLESYSVTISADSGGQDMVMRELLFPHVITVLQYKFEAEEDIARHMKLSNTYISYIPPLGISVSKAIEKVQTGLRELLSDLL